jgi:hypothetical protein
MSGTKVLPTATEQRLIAANALKGKQRSRIFRIAYGYRVTGPFDVARFAAAVRKLAADVPLLRSVFDEHPIFASELIVRDDLEVFFDHGEVADAEQFLARAASVETAYTKGPLFQVDLARHGDAYVMLLSWDHSIVDAWSVSLCVRWLGELYGGREQLPDAATLWPEYGHREAEALSAIDEPGVFWRDQVTGARPARVAVPVSDESSGLAASVTVPLAGAGFPQQCRAVKATPGAILIASALLTAGADDADQDPRPVAMPTMFANRDPRYQDSIGLFMRTIFVRVDLAGDRTVGDVRRDTLRELGRCFRHRQESVVYLLEQYRAAIDALSTFPLPFFAQLLDVPAREPHFEGCEVELAYHGFDHIARFGAEAYMRPQADGGIEGAYVYDRVQYKLDDIERAARRHQAWIRLLLDPEASGTSIRAARETLLA